MKTVSAYLRMSAAGGQFPIPTSEVAYNDNIVRIDRIFPLNGGKLQADGAWLQESWKIAPAWPQSLPGLAQQNNQIYMPVVGCDRNGVLNVLDNPTVQQTAADNLINLALNTRFDAPWDGVVLNLEGVPSSYKGKLSQFFYLLSYKIRLSGMGCAISVRGIAGDPGPDYDDAYSHDFRVLSQIADIVDVYCYTYWNPTNGSVINRSMAPYWWMQACIEYALGQGIPADRMSLGQGLFSKYYPNSSSNSSSDITYNQAVQLANDANVPIQWIERNGIGIARERFADLGAGHVWIHDGDTLRHGLDLVDKYGLMGMTHFTPGMGDDYHWQVIGDWKAV